MTSPTHAACKILGKRLAEWLGGVRASLSRRAVGVAMSPEAAAACLNRMPENCLPPTRYAPAMNLPPYAYVPGHGLPHPVNDPDGHLYATRDSGHSHGQPISSVALAALPSEPDERRCALAAVLTRNHAWLFALDLFNAGFYWEAHEAWEPFWHALGRATPEARFIQALIHLAAACVKIREGRPVGVKSHTQRAHELAGAFKGVANDGGEAADGESAGVGSLGIVPESLAAVFAELNRYQPACWHTSRCPVVKVLVAGLAVVPPRPGPSPWPLRPSSPNV